MFEENQINNGQLLLENVKTIQIIGCTFDIDSQSKSSIYCLNNKFGSEIELIGCTFDIDCAFFSKTSKNTHYIDGKLLEYNVCFYKNHQEFKLMRVYSRAKNNMFSI